VIRKTTLVNERWSVKDRIEVTYRIAGTMECEDLPALFPELPQPLDSVRPSRNPDWIDGTRMFNISDGESNRRPCRVSVYREIVPELQSYTTAGELDMMRFGRTNQELTYQCG